MPLFWVYINEPETSSFSLIVAFADSELDSLAERRVRDDALRVVARDRETRAGVIERLRDGEVVRDRGAGAEEVPNVVRVRDPRLCLAAELIDQDARRAWAPRLVGAVIHAAAGAVDVLEVAAEALAILILISGKIDNSSQRRAAREAELRAARRLTRHSWW